MASLDRPRTTDFAWVPASEERQADEDKRTARNKLLVLAADSADIGLKHRLVESSDRRTLLSVWDPNHQSPSETIAYVSVAEKDWQFTSHPFGPMLGSAEGVEKPGDAVVAAKAVADRLGVQL